LWIKATNKEEFVEERMINSLELAIAYVKEIDNWAQSLIIPSLTKQRKLEKHSLRNFHGDR
jgi:hypothetical protein